MINKQLIPVSQYDVKCPYEIVPVGISIHNNGNPKSTAQNERDNLSWTRDERSFHFVSDEKGTIQIIPENRNSWANSDFNKGWNSKAYLNWEICELNYSKSEEMAIKDIAKFLYSKGWGVERIKNHSSFDPTSGCPRYTLKHWNDFIAKIQKELDDLKPSADGGVKLYKDAKFCHKCQYELNNTCPICGSEYDENGECPLCIQSLEEENNSNEKEIKQEVEPETQVYDSNQKFKKFKIRFINVI